MIRIGLSKKEKIDLIRDQAAKRGMDKIFVFYPRKFPLEVEANRHVEWDEIIMYRTFYPLLETIDRKTLLVFNEIMRTRNRHELTYNCAHHYCNQAGQVLVFEYFPFIEDSSDFPILLDLLDKPRYKGRPFDWGMLQEQDVGMRRVGLEARSHNVQAGQSERRKYEAKKEKLFAELHEESDPDNIPRNLHVYVGNFKKPHLNSERDYVARNSRFKMTNVVTYKDVQPGRFYTVIDFPHRRIDFTDFLKTTGQTRVDFVNTGLPVDVYYFNELETWIQRLEEFYAQAGLC